MISVGFFSVCSCYGLVAIYRKIWMGVFFHLNGLDDVDVDLDAGMGLGLLYIAYTFIFLDDLEPPP